MAGLIVRASRVDDAGAIAALSNYYIRETAVHFGMREQEPSYFAQIIEHDSVMYPWVTAEAGGRFAGFAKAGLWREREAYAKTVESAVYVERGMEGRGVGRALYGVLLDELRKRGFHTVVAGATMPNEGSVRLHESVGFEFVGRFREVGRKMGAWHDVGWWQLML
ncbi:MAG: N-acetyltransferase [Phycisphaerales bacterium]|nr:N-acetyltransferase [Phycisphaerales bacterium]